MTLIQHLFAVLYRYGCATVGGVGGEEIALRLAFSFRMATYGVLL